MSAQDHTCLNHPDVPAATHCAQCHKPICEDCIAQTRGEAAFCSVECLADYLRFQGRMEDIEEREMIGRRRRRRAAVIRLVVLAAVAAAAWIALRRLGWLCVSARSPTTRDFATENGRSFGGKRPPRLLVLQSPQVVVSASSAVEK